MQEMETPWRTKVYKVLPQTLRKVFFETKTTTVYYSSRWFFLFFGETNASEMNRNWREIEWLWAVAPFFYALRDVRPW